MPIDLVRADPHRWKLEPVPEHAALRDDLEGTLDIIPRGARTVEQEAMILRPDLDVARQRLVVQPQVPGRLLKRTWTSFCSIFASRTSSS